MRLEAFMDAALSNPISPSELKTSLGAHPPPTLIDVRRAEAYARDPVMIAEATRLEPEAIDVWSRELEPWREVVVYCVHGHEVSQNAAAELGRRGLAARFLEGGLEGWRAAGGETQKARPPTRWVTRERPKIDRIACPWLIRRFIDPNAEFFYVPAAEVRAFAAANGAEPYDVPDVRYSHHGPNCSFDAFIDIHALSDAALADLATIVRGADTAALELAAQSAGLLAVSRGLSRMFADDFEMLRWGMLVYDALYAWCREARDKTDGPDTIRPAAA
jgi:rhodanese-related sulfurtransferase